MTDSVARIALVTGASRGLGLETARALIARGHRTIITGRNVHKLEAAKAELGDGDLVMTYELDVADQSSVDQLFDWLDTLFGRLDILVNNAGRLTGGYGATILNTPAQIVAETIDNNALSAYRMIQKALPMMNAQGFGRIVNVSSGMGALNDMGGGAVAYRLSKTAMNAVTRSAHSLAETNVKVNAVCPGWVKTDMGGPSATRSLDQGIEGIVWAATLPADGPSGGFFRDGKPIAW